MKTIIENIKNTIWKEISIDNLIHNLNYIKNIAGKEQKILAVVKADAYGHGTEIIAKSLEQNGVCFFGISSIREAVNLRKTGIKGSILLLGQVLEDEIPLLFEYNIISTVSSYKYACLLDDYCRVHNKTANVHVKVDTGMGRFGIEVSKALPLIEFLIKGSRICVQGIYSHFASADCDLEFSKIQCARFKDLIDKLEQQEIYIALRHMANSSAIFNLDNDDCFNMVRPGLSLYGYTLSEFATGEEKNISMLKPVLSLKTKLVFKKEIKQGQAISYGRTFKAEKNMVIGIIPIGYSHGLDRTLSNKGEVLIFGEYVKIVGRVCMDYTMIDITDFCDKAVIGDEVVIIGKSGKKEITVNDICAKIDKIPYEVLCGIKVH